MCQYCEIEPVFTTDSHGRNVYDKDKSQKVLDPGGMYSQLVIGTDKDGRVFMEADEVANRLWYPNFCPVCGRDLRQSNRPTSGKDLIGQILAKAEQGRILIDSIQNSDNHEI